MNTKEILTALVVDKLKKNDIAYFMDSEDKIIPMGKGFGFNIRVGQFSETHSGVIRVFAVDPSTPYDSVLSTLFTRLDNGAHHVPGEKFEIDAGPAQEIWTLVTEILKKEEEEKNIEAEKQLELLMSYLTAKPEVDKV